MQQDKTSLLRKQSRAFHNAGLEPKPRDANEIFRTNGASALRSALDGAAPITLPTDGTAVASSALPASNRNETELIVRRASDVVPQPVVWLWPGRMALGKLTILSAEDGLADTIVPRLHAAGANCERVYIISAVRNRDRLRTFNLQADLALLEQT